MTYLVFDVETTGLIDFKADLLAPHQPRIIQLAAALVGEGGDAIAEMNAFIKPDGWTVPEGAASVNGITTEKCEAVGIPITSALAMFNAMKGACKTRVAHNLNFDKQMLAREAGACGMPHDSAGIESFCTMQASRAICKLAPTDKMMAAGIKSFKSPNLQEAYRHFFGRDFDGAHDAMADVRACKDVFFAMRRLKAAA